MSDNITIARPYAKAVFEVALQHKNLAEWSNILSVLTCAIDDVEAQQFFLNPETTAALQIELLDSVIQKTLPKSMLELGANFVRMLIENSRVLLLPEISLEFERLRADYEKTLVVDVKTFSPLTSEQHTQLVERLSNRLQRKVTLDINLDPSLLGGVVISAGDLVIDDSVRSKLIKLETSLVS
jgi:F-type H+-transporting ATPase subunit delta